ncbi:MAG: flagellar basal body-associated protein FliL [Firmicutes bacterium ADurb.Bin419]|nr:MAG: flagellar basal body-associated protein FliL [Firmicutes bacterium ADurb.Bin419]
MEGKRSGFFILIGIVAFLSLALALLAGYVFFLQGNNSNEEQKKQIIVPKDGELLSEKMFEEKTAFNLRTEGKDNEIHVILVNVELNYFAKFKGIKDTTVKIQSNKSKLIELVGTYFQGLTIDEVKKADSKEKARAELKKKMNELLLQNEEKDGELVYSVVFEYWFYQ